MNPEKARVLLSSKAYQKSVQYAKKCSTEVWGLVIGDVKEDTFKVDDIVLFGHLESSGARAEPIYMQREKWMMENPKIVGENFERYLGWYHTHVGVSATPSATDINTISRLGDWTLTLIANNAGDMYAQLNVRTKIIEGEELDLEFKNLSLKHEIKFDKKLENKIDKELKEKVDPYKKSWGSSHGYGSGYGGRGYYNGPKRISGCNYPAGNYKDFLHEKGRKYLVFGDEGYGVFDFEYDEDIVDDT